MKIKKSKNTKKPLLITLLAAAIFATIFLAVAYTIKIFPFDDRRSTTIISEEIKNQYATRDKEERLGTEGLPDNSPTITTDQVPTSDDLSVDITSTSQEAGVVKASAKTSGSGTCVFLYTTEGDKPVTHQSESSNGSCHASINEIEFSKLGQWQLKVTYYQDNKKAEVTQDVTIR